MNLINAGISKGDIYTAEKRLRSGEVFYVGQCKIYYDASYLPNSSPYRLQGDELKCCWDSVDEWVVEKETEFNFPCLCWVSDYNENPREEPKNIEIIYNKLNISQNCYESKRYRWEYAIPLTNEELKKYSNNGVEE